MESMGIKISSFNEKTFKSLNKKTAQYLPEMSYLGSSAVIRSFGAMGGSFSAFSPSLKIAMITSYMKLLNNEKIIKDRMSEINNM